MKGNDKVKWIGCSTKQLPDVLEETFASYSRWKSQLFL